MNNNIKRKVIGYLSIATILNVLVGCSFINVYSEIKNDPMVMDVEIYQIEDEVVCKIILESDAENVDTMAKAAEYRETIQKEFKHSNITIMFIQNEIEFETY